MPCVPATQSKVPIYGRDTFIPIPNSGLDKSASLLVGLQMPHAKMQYVYNKITFYYSSDSNYMYFRIGYDI